MLKKQSSLTKADIYYYDIGDYLRREDKLSIVKSFRFIGNDKIMWQRLKPNEHGDWLNHRNKSFDTFMPIASNKKYDLKTESFFILNSLGINTNRDAWVYGFSSEAVKCNMKKMVAFYNQQVSEYLIASKKEHNLEANDFINKDPKKISWSSSLIPHVQRGNNAYFEPNKMSDAIYRPFCKQHLYMGDKMIHRRGQFDQIFNCGSDSDNCVICCHGFGGNKDYSVLASNHIVDLNCLEAGAQCFPLYYYVKRNTESSLFDKNDENIEYIRRDGVSDFILDRAQKIYGKRVSKEDIFTTSMASYAPKYRETLQMT